MAKASSSNEIQVFEDFTDDEVLTISHYSEKKFYQRDEVVFKEKSKDASLYVVLSGKLEALAHTSDNKKISLSFIDEGEVFGELSFLDGKIRSATIIAVTDVELLQISRQEFNRLRLEHPDIASKLIMDLARVVSLRLRNADKFIVDIFQLINKDSNNNGASTKETSKTVAKNAKPAGKATKGSDNSKGKAAAKPAAKAAAKPASKAAAKPAAKTAAKPASKAAAKPAAKAAAKPAAKPASKAAAKPAAKAAAKPASKAAAKPASKAAAKPAAKPAAKAAAKPASKAAAKPAAKAAAKPAAKPAAKGKTNKK
jgi:CRP-like cAMP-binding protein